MLFRSIQSRLLRSLLYIFAEGSIAGGGLRCGGCFVAGGKLWVEPYVEFRAEPCAELRAELYVKLRVELRAEPCADA